MYSFVPMVYRSGKCVNSMYMQNFSLGRRLTFANFAVLWLFAKVFSAKFGGVAFLAQPKQAIRESFLHKNHIFHQFAQVSSSKDSAVWYYLIFMIQWLTGSAEKIDALAQRLYSLVRCG